MVHFSTDYVFDGLASSPYHEEDKTNPLNVYGASKLKGEKIQNACIIRTSWLFGQFGKNFVQTMIRLMMEKKPYPLFQTRWVALHALKIWLNLQYLC